MKGGCFFGVIFVQPDDLGIFFVFFCSTEIQELEPEILGQTKMRHLFEMMRKGDSGVGTAGGMFFFQKELKISKDGIITHRGYYPGLYYPYNS